MYTFIADTETNGFRATVFHSLVIIRARPPTSNSFADQPGFPQISDGIKMLEAANKIVRHNFLGFDLKWLEKLRHARISPSRVLETLLAGRIRWADLRDAGRWAGFRTAT